MSGRASYMVYYLVAGQNMCTSKYAGTFFSGLITIPVIFYLFLYTLSSEPVRFSRHIEVLCQASRQIGHRVRLVGKISDDPALPQHISWVSLKDFLS